MIRYAIENNRIAKEYLVNYTNAAFVVKEGFKLPEDGLYSGFDAAAGTYDKSTWNYEEGGNVGPKLAVAGGKSPTDATLGLTKSSAGVGTEQQKQGQQPATN